MTPIDAGQETAERPSWLECLIGCKLPREGESITLPTGNLTVTNGIPRLQKDGSAAQDQTAGTFGYKWHRVDSYDSPSFTNLSQNWLRERYGAVEDMDWLGPVDGAPRILLDAGCGSGWSSINLFRSRLANIRYLGVDISGAVDLARYRFAEQGFDAAFLQADLCNLPLPEGSVDVVFSEGVLHHTDNTEHAFHALARLVRPGGRFLFYVYRRKGPIREFSDDYIRARLQDMDPETAWRALMPLTRLGEALGRLGCTVEVPEPIDLLGIPAGPIDVQRLFYWHVFKAFYRPDLTLEEMNHINFDWYAPRNAHRHTVEEVRGWCADAGFTIERECVQEAGITMIARATAGEPAG